MSKDDFFVEIEGRKVPTSKKLRKMRLMTRDGSISTIKTKVSDSDYKLTPEQVRTIVWNLMKYSSITFLERLIMFLKTIEKGYEMAISVFPNVRDIDIEKLKYLNEAINVGVTGWEYILSGNKESGYKRFRGLEGIKKRSKLGLAQPLTLFLQSKMRNINTVEVRNNKSVLTTGCTMSTK